VVDRLIAVLNRRAVERHEHAERLRVCGTLIKQTPGARTLADVEARLGRAEMERRLQALLNQPAN